MPWEVDPSKSADAVVVPIGPASGAHVVVQLGGKSFDVATEEGRAAIKPVLADLRRQKIQAGRKAADVFAVLSLAIPQSDEQINAGYAACQAAGFVRVEWVLVERENQPKPQFQENDGVFQPATERGRP